VYTLQDAKIRSAEQMLNTLRKLCGFVPMFILPLMDHPGNYGNEHRTWLCVSQTNLFNNKFYRCIQICKFVIVIISAHITDTNTHAISLIIRLVRVYTRMHFYKLLFIQNGSNEGSVRTNT